MSSREEILNGDWIYDKEELNKHLMQLKPDGFVLKDLEYVKKEAGKTTTLSYLVALDSPFDARISGLSHDVSFEQVEKIFNDVHKTVPGQSIPHELGDDTFHELFRRNIIGEDGYYFLIDNTVYNEMSFQRIKPYVYNGGQRSS